MRVEFFNMKADFFKIINIIFLIVEGLLVVMPILAAVLFTSMNGNPDFNLSNLQLIPTDPNLLNHYEDHSVTLKGLPNEKVELMITETAIRVKETQLFLFPMLIIGLVFLVLGLVMLEMIRRMVKTVQQGDPFVKNNVMRINILGTIFLLVPLSTRFMYTGLDRWIKSNIEFTGLELQKSSISGLPWLLGGFLLFTIGKIILEGIKIKEEQSLTI